MMTDKQIIEKAEDIMSQVIHEVVRTAEKYPPFNSAHEGFAVLKEEVDELWDEVKMKQKNRNLAKMQYEAIQVAAMAIRFAMEVCGPETGLR